MISKQKKMLTCLHTDSNVCIMKAFNQEIILIVIKLMLISKVYYNDRSSDMWPSIDKVN